MRNSWLLPALLILLICPFALHAQETPPPQSTPTAQDTPPPADRSLIIPAQKAQPVRVPRFESQPLIDGKLDDPVWQSATVLADFYQVQPGDNIKPSKPTEVLLGFDDKFFYMAFRAHDDPGKVQATVAKRDDVFNDDNVGVYLDTFNDQRRAYVLAFNPLGVQQDGISTEGSGDDFSVDIVMESKGLVTAEGFVVEIAIPFKSLRYEAGRGKFWGVHFVREIKRFNSELDSWMPISRTRSGWLNQTGRITGLEHIATSRPLELIPNLTLSETGRRVASPTPAVADPGRFVNEPLSLDLGLTGKFGITPAVTLDLAINPDFAQVEADEFVVTANQRFPIFFPERRPFFLEGIDIFQTPLTAVHTRAIVDPDVAVKLSGQRGRNTFGLMLASDNAPGNFQGDERLDPSNRPFLDKNAYIGVLRLKRNIGDESALGLIATTYNFIQQHNHLGGFDGRVRFDQQTVLTFQALGTTSRRNFFDADLGRDFYRTGNGFGYSFNLQRSGRNFGLDLIGEGRTSNYRADVGFTPRTNTNFNALQLRYRSTPRPRARLISWRARSLTHIDYDFQGRSQIWETEGRLTLDFPLQSFFGVAYERGYERLFEEEFGPKRTPARAGAFFGPDAERASDKNHYFAFCGTRPNKHWSADCTVIFRNGHFDLDFGAGPKFPRVSPAALLNPNAPLDPGRGNLLEIAGSVDYQPTDPLRISLDFTKNRLVREDTGRVAFDDNIYSLRVTHQFTRFTFVRARMDYSTLAANVRGQFLLGWTPNPGTSFYAGYNDDLNRNGFSPFTGQLEPGFRRNGRTFFVKLSYLIRRNL